MGCCLSREGDAHSPYSGGDATGSSRAINEEAQAAGSSGSNTGYDDSSSRRRRRYSHQPLAQHINKPLRRHDWTSHDRLWTPAALRRERIEFFDTRVSGRQEIWQTIHAALEVLWAADEVARKGQSQRLSEDGGPSEDDPATALMTAQSILDAAEITLPTGDLHDGAYDAFGNFYQLPRHIISDPTNLVWRPGMTEDDDLEDTKADLSGGETCEEREDADEAERRRVEKGKAVIDIRDQITVKARLSDTSQDVVVFADKKDTVRRIARLIAEEAQLPSNKKIRIAYMGKILQENSPLEAQGWKQGHVVNALVFDR
ncbi:uncharacterized protein CTHT_0034870 [Thermochaetoides thermophila DSM 1495]|uniref:Ubiquitin-like domain-containing protein n=1 Tax=Chaetomium thermophilum (strain DSM 1495 / CBS 144.50 / IMI 039719) TaxID=759272 RepID=G0S6G8_CHATD|nr:hypothetical protein CTHT_0034870 [Thermochaetoides thermophila DSM 1495]EGS21623.1 hypothetical protein CTHT_0034870 [Thermochaetoides thermophila DSM 1495]